jgi:hypothetical protein
MRALSTLLIAALAVAAAAGCGGQRRTNATAPAPPPRSSTTTGARTPAQPQVAGAIARGGWTTRPSRPFTAPELLAPRMALQREGGALVAVQGVASGAVDCEHRDTTGAFLTRFALDGSLGPVRGLGGDLVAGPVALGAGRGAALVTERLPGSNDCDPVSRLALVDLHANGSTGRRRTVVRQTTAVWQAAMSSSSRSRLAIAWIEVRDETTFRLRVVLRFASGRLTAPVTLARGDGIAPQGPAIDGLDVALTDDGAALVAYVQSRAAHLVTLRPDGTIARRRTLGASQESARVVVAAGRGGRAAVAWGSQDGGEERNVPYVVRATAKSAGSDSFAAARIVDPGGAVLDPPGHLGLRLAADGRALLVWDQVDRDATPVTRYADAPPRDTFGLTHELRYAGLVALALRPDGAAAVALSRDGYLTVRHRAAAGGSFTALGRPTLARVYDGDLAYTPGGDLLLVWGQVPRNGRAQLFAAHRR